MVCLPTLPERIYIDNVLETSFFQQIWKFGVSFVCFFKFVIIQYDSPIGGLGVCYKNIVLMSNLL